MAERLREAFLKPEPETSKAHSKGARNSKDVTLEDLESEARYANDTERVFGLLAAPCAAAIGLVVTSELISHDPPALMNGRPDRLHVPVSDYHDLIIVLLGLAALMLASAWFRKRLYLGIVMALYGLTIFNLKYWGFGVPFVMVAAWLLVRSYRTQRDLREATASGPTAGGGTRKGPAPPGGPGSSRRYTPRTQASRRPSSSKQKNDRRAG